MYIRIYNIQPSYGSGGAKTEVPHFWDLKTAWLVVEMPDIGVPSYKPSNCDLLSWCVRFQTHEYDIIGGYTRISWWYTRIYYDIVMMLQVIFPSWWLNHLILLNPHISSAVITPFCSLKTFCRVTRLIPRRDITRSHTGLSPLEINGKCRRHVFGDIIWLVVT